MRRNFIGLLPHTFAQGRNRLRLSWAARNKNAAGVSPTAFLIACDVAG
jgi:hypothetical protein